MDGMLDVLAVKGIAQLGQVSVCGRGSGGCVLDVLAVKGIAQLGQVSLVAALDVFWTYFASGLKLDFTNFHE